MIALRSKVLLVYPHISRRERYRGLLGAFGGRQIPLGIYCLAAYLRQYGCGVEAIDAEALGIGPHGIVERLRRGDFDLLGLSTTTAVFHEARAVARAAKAAFPALPIVVGGPHVSALPVDCLEEESFDYAVPSEGEETLRDLVVCLENDADPASVQGLVFRKDGIVYRNPARPLIADLDKLPAPAYDLIPEMRLYNPPPFTFRQSPVANVMSSRGCEGQCTFCSRAAFGRRVRFRSPESVVDELEQLVQRHGVREIAFVDDAFTLNQNRLAGIFELAARKGLKFPWTCRTRADMVDEPLLRFMAAHGCWHISIGVESADQDILGEIRKGITPAQVASAVESCRKVGLVTKGFFMVGHPRESEETIERTIRFALELELDQISVTVNTPLPGTYQYRHAAKYGTLDARNWSAFTLWKPVFVPHGMNAELLVQKHNEFIHRFYLRPRWLLKAGALIVRQPQLLAQVGRIVLDLVRTLAARMLPPWSLPGCAF